MNCSYYEDKKQNLNMKIKNDNVLVHLIIDVKIRIKCCLLFYYFCMNLPQITVSCREQHKTYTYYVFLTLAASKSTQNSSQSYSCQTTSTHYYKWRIVSMLLSAIIGLKITLRKPRNM